MNYKITWPNGIHANVSTINEMVIHLKNCQERGFELHQLRIERDLRVSEILHAQAAAVEKKHDGVSPAAASVGGGK